MSLLGFAKVILKAPRAAKNMGIKRGVGFIAKHSIKEVGKIPAIAGIVAYPVGAVAGACIPGTGLLASLTAVTLTKGALQAPKVIKNIAQKSSSIFSK